MSVFRRFSTLMTHKEVNEAEISKENDLPRITTIEIVGCKVTCNSSYIPDTAWATCTIIGSKTSDLEDVNIENKTKQKLPLFFNDASFHKIWTFHEYFNVVRECKIAIEVNCNFGKKGVFRVGYLLILPSALSEEVLDYELKNDSDDPDIRNVTGTISLRIKPAPSVDTTPSPTLGFVRLCAWQGKNINTEYPVYLKCFMNVKDTRSYRSNVVQNPNHPVFDYIAEIDIYSLEGDFIVELWEKHAVRNNKPIGQVIFPLSWLVMEMSIVKLETISSISGWFEIFPYNRPSKYNRGGQYRPYVTGIPVSTGYGMNKPERPLGYIKLDIFLQLKESLFSTLLKYPFCHRRPPIHISLEDEDPGIASLYIAKHNINRIIHSFKDPPLVDVVLDILNWRTPIVYTFGALYLHCYTCLLAPVWQYPFIVLIVLVATGLISRTKYESKDVQLFDIDKDKSKEEEEEEKSTSLSEKYKSLKLAAANIERTVLDAAEKFERIKNLLTWSNPLVSAGVIVLLMMVAIFSSFMLCFIRPSFFVFMAGLTLFIPEHEIEKIKEVFITVASFSKNAINGKFFSGTAPAKSNSGGSAGSGLTQLSLDVLPAMRGHEISGFLFSKTWPIFFVGESTAATHSELKKGKFTSRWCELWKYPQALKICSTDNVMGDAGGNACILYSLQGVAVNYLGAKQIVINRNRGNSFSRPHGQSIGGKRNSVDSDDSSRFSTVSAISGLTGADDHDLDEKAEKTLIFYEFEVVSTDGYAWVFACKNEAEALGWVETIQKVSEIKGRTEEEVHEQKLSTRIKAFIADWLNMVPDDLEVQHRLLCTKSKVLTNQSKSAVPVSAPSNYKYASPDKDILNPLAPVPTDNISFLVSVINARGLPLKEKTAQIVGPIANMLPKVLVAVSISPTHLQAATLRTAGQPRSENPMWREDLTFYEISKSLLLAENAKLVIAIILKTPLSVVSDSEVVLGCAEVYLPPLFRGDKTFSPPKNQQQPEPGIADWFPLFNKDTGLVLPNNAAVQIKVQLL